MHDWMEWNQAQKDGCFQEAGCRDFLGLASHTSSNRANAGCCRRASPETSPPFLAVSPAHGPATDQPEPAAAVSTRYRVR